MVSSHTYSVSLVSPHMEISVFEIFSAVTHLFRKVSHYQLEPAASQQITHHLSVGVARLLKKHCVNKQPTTFSNILG